MAWKLDLNNEDESCDINYCRKCFEVKKILLDLASRMERKENYNAEIFKLFGLFDIVVE